MDAARIAAGEAEWDTIGALIKARGHNERERLAVEVAGRQLTYGELNDLSDRVATGLTELGVGMGDRVASFAFNCIEQLLVFFGTVKIGAVWVPLNVSLQRQDLAYCLDDAAPAVLVTDQDLNSRVDEIAANVKVRPRRFVIGETAAATAFEHLTANGGAVPTVTVRRQDAAVIIYTGGTTGLPKGVILPHFAWIAAG